MTGCNLREALAIARKHGLRVVPVEGTGEVRVYFPGRPCVRLNARRKDAPRALTSGLQRYLRELVS